MFIWSYPKTQAQKKKMGITNYKQLMAHQWPLTKNMNNGMGMGFCKLSPFSSSYVFVCKMAWQYLIEYDLPECVSKQIPLYGSFWKGVCSYNVWKCKCLCFRVKLFNLYLTPFKFLGYTLTYGLNWHLINSKCRVMHNTLYLMHFRNLK
jgi:hypothetical protein